MEDSVFVPGMLVALPGRRGLATVLSSEAGRCRVSLFHSVQQSLIEEHPETALARAFVGPETRVYVAANGGWLVGRVKDFDPAPHPLIEYVVRFPNGRVADLPEDRVRVRVFEPHADPAEVLAAGGGESQYFHDRRWSTLASAVRLRAAAQGLTGALSAKIELAPHQMSAARRVLTDPIPRYLLADEVGMGKTIEAGVIARQCLIDDPSRRVEVLAPAPLIEQWRGELFDRCGLGEFPAGAVAVRGHESLGAIEAVPDLLIVDEAHNVLAQPRARGRLTTLAHAAPRLLLLSATPALGSPNSLLDLLHLLDPNAYATDDLPKLEHRLTLGRDLGRLLLTLTDDAPAFLVKRSLADLATRLPDDEVVATAAKRYADETPVADELADVRQHLADTYRVHQRIVRARRADAAVYFQPRGILREGRRDHLREEVDEDRRWPDVLASLEDLREDLAGGADAAAAQQFVAMVEKLGAELSAGALPVNPPGLAEALDQEPGPRDRNVVALDILRSWVRRLQQEGERTPKIVVFASRRAVAARLEEALGLADQHAVLLDENLAPAIARQRLESFRDHPGPSVLVCDRSGEEGLNLSFADAILHLDLPLSATRMEQRIGRLDRFGRAKRCIRQRVLLPSDEDASPWAAWLEVLRDGFEIFETSASDVQFVLPALEADLALALLQRGADGLRAMIPDVRDRLAAARRAADEQYALDSVALGDGGAGLVDAIEQAEEDEAALQAAAEGWLVEALHFQPVQADGGQVSYLWTRDTVVPRRPWEEEFASGVDRPSTWRRRVALRRDLALLRPGSRFVDAMERHLRWDDRGSAFATWRVDPEAGDHGLAWIGFRLCFVVEPALAQDLAVFGGADAQGLTRRAQAFLPPWTAVFHVDADGQPPPDRLRGIVERRYDKETGSRGGRDFNLCSRPELLGRVAPPLEFARLCREVRDRAGALLCQDPAYAERIRDGVRRAEIDARRRARLNGETSEETARLVGEAVRSPRLRLDSMGLLVVSSDPPPKV